MNLYLYRKVEEETPERYSLMLSRRSVTPVVGLSAARVPSGKFGG